MDQAVLFLQLHERLLADDPTASAEIADRLFIQVRDDLRRKYPQDGYQYVVNHAATEAFVSYFQRPEQFDPEKANLQTYLRISAEGDLKNALRSERNFLKKYQTGVELSQFEGKGEVEAEPLSMLQGDELREEIRKLFPEERDWELAELIIDQERRTEPFAEILGIQHLSVDEQRAEVKRHKDRIKQKLRRFGDSIRESTEPE